MPLTKSAQTPQASATNSAGATTTSSTFAIGYGISGVAVITNGGTGPTIPCDFVIECSNDSGTTWFEFSRQTAGVTASASYRFPFSFGVAGSSGDWTSYRTKFTGNTAQAVTIQADACTTTTL